MGSCENGVMHGDMKPMDPEEFRDCGYKMVDFIADYYKNIDKFPVCSQVKPGYLKILLPDKAPEDPETLEDVLADVQRKIIPGVTHWQSPKFFSFFSSNSSTAGILGEMLSAGLNVIGFSWITSPASTELETIVLDWLGKLLGLPQVFLSGGEGGGVIQGTASEAVLVTLLAARTKALKRIGAQSLSKLVVYASNQTHSALLKACLIAGICAENFRVLTAEATTNYALDPIVVSKAVAEDVAAGLVPLFLCGTVGTTSSTATDPLSELGEIAKDHGMWFHVDAAYAGSACICPEYQHYLCGVEKADSFNMNAHKWFLTNFDCSALWVKDSSALVDALSTNPEFLKNKVSEAKLVSDYKDWQIPLGRRFRSLKLWMVLRLYGASGLRKYIRNHIKLAEHFENLVHADSRFEIMVPRTFALVCFRLKPFDGDQDNGYALNSSLLEAVNASGEMYFSHTVLSGVYVLRLAIGAPLTEQIHVDGAWKVIQEHATRIQCH
eukprot:c27032_g1_i2 orf=156-1640(+)